MAGGVVLMAVLVNILPVSSAMVLHGITQFTANGSRTLILRKHLMWRLLPATSWRQRLPLRFSALLFVPDASVVLILVGLFPWLARLQPNLAHSILPAQHPTSSAVSALPLRSYLQALRPIIGSVLSQQWLGPPNSRGKQSAHSNHRSPAAHFYYGAIISVATPLPNWLFLAAAIAAVIGTRLGTWLLARWDDQRFQKVSGQIILATGTICILQGSYQLIRSAGFMA